MLFGGGRGIDSVSKNPLEAHELVLLAKDTKWERDAKKHFSLLQSCTICKSAGKSNVLHRSTFPSRLLSSTKWKILTDPK